MQQFPRKPSILVSQNQPSERTVETCYAAEDTLQFCWKQGLKQVLTERSKARSEIFRQATGGVFKGRF
jgi:hypothetical protein